MSKRLETIKRLAETDDYWKGYLDGLNRTREADAVEWREYARLMQARLARAVDDVADRSEFRPVDEVRARLRARRLDRNADTTDYDSEWRMVAPVISREEYAARLRYRERKAAQVAEGDWDWDSLDA